MKISQGLAFFGTVGVAVSVQPHGHAEPHGHVHRHAEKHVANRVDRRADFTTYVAGPTTTIYELDGKELSQAEVDEGIREGIYVLVTQTSVGTYSKSTASAAEFFQKSSSSTSSTTSTSTSSTSSTAAATTSSAYAPTQTPATSGGSSGGSGVNSKFVSGTVPCSDFPEDYGAVPAPWLNLGGWLGIQHTPDYSVGAGAISNIITVVPGMGNCIPGSFCSYACPAGYQKVQWPTAQGATGQSIGGLYCNAAGLLELSNPNYDTLCGAGTGQVQVTNNLSQNVAICRTDYPGTESETVALNTLPGQTNQLTCPDASTYYTWGGKPTSAQYYINPAGVSVDQACIWGDGSTQTGNWAPINLGVGKGIGGETFISLFWNTPTNPNPSLAYNIEITGGISGSCKFSGGQFYSNGVANSNGCTVSVTGLATYVLSD